MTRVEDFLVELSSTNIAEVSYSFSAVCPA
jgi:hypothetical protein